MKLKFYPTIWLLAILLLATNFSMAQSWSAKTNFGGTARKDACGFSISNKGYVGTGDDGVRKKDLWEYDQNTDAWTQKADMPTTNGRDKACGFAIGTKGYIACGNDGSAYLNDCYEYDPVGNTWTAKANFPGTARQNATGYSIGTKGYVTCGYDGLDQKLDHYEFDPVGNSWTARANFSGGKREKAVGFGCTNNKGYVGTGWDGSTRKRDWHEFDPNTNTWTQKGDFAGTQRTDACGFAIGSKGYLGCGNDGSLKADFWEYNPTTDIWTQQPDYIGTPRGKAVGLGIGSRGYVGTGEDASGRSKTWHEFKPCDTWERKADFPGTGRVVAFGFALGNKGYFGTGFDGIAPDKKDVWEYDPSTDSWTQVADFGGTARHSTYSFVIGTKGYVGGGWDGMVNNNDLWEYNQGTNTWTAKANLPAAGRIDALGMAINGKGYVGTGNSGVLHNDWYEYNPGTNAWTAKTNFPGSARSATAGFVIGNFGYMGTGNDGTKKKDFYRYNPANDTWLQVADCGILTRDYAIGFTLCNLGHIVTGFDASSNHLREHWEYNPLTNTWVQKIDFGGSARFGSSAFVIGCNAYVGLGAELGGTFSKELWEYRGCCCGGGGGGVGGGGGGGIESQSLGDIIAKRIFTAAIANKSLETDYTKAAKFVKNNTTTVNGPSNLSLVDLIPTSVAGTTRAVVSTPTDLIQFTNALEVLSVDYLNVNTARAVVFATRTAGSIYGHTKPICDRLRGAELLEVVKLNVNGYNLVAYKIKQQTGEVEFAANLSAGVQTARNTISLQSNWFTSSYLQDEKLFNFQIWATNYETVNALAANVVARLQTEGTVNLVNNSGADLPQTFITKGTRLGSNLNLSIHNKTGFTTGYVELEEKINETAATIKRSVPITLTANGIANVNIAVSDAYESNLYVYVNNKLVDLVYLSDGAWDVAYDKNNTSISNFAINNDVSFINNSNELALMRNATVTGASKDYVSVYKLVKAGGVPANLTAFNGLRFNATSTGFNAIKVTLTKKSITNWNDQYTLRIPINDKGEYEIAFADLKNGAGLAKFNPDDVLIANFTFERGNNVNSNFNASISKARFVQNAKQAAMPAIQTAKTFATFPNPNKGKFGITFIAEADANFVLRVIEISTGRTLKTQFINAKQGTNNVNVDLGTGSKASGVYTVTLESDGIKYQSQKLLLNK